MKIYIFCLLLFLPLSIYAKESANIASMRIYLETINQIRKDERIKAQKIYAAFRAGELDEEDAEKAFDKIDTRIETLNKEKEYIEQSIIHEQKSLDTVSQDTPSPPVVPAQVLNISASDAAANLDYPQVKTPTQPPAPIVRHAGLAFLDGVLYIGRFILIAFFVAVTAIVGIKAYVSKTKPKETTVETQRIHSIRQIGTSTPQNQEAFTSETSIVQAEEEIEVIDISSEPEVAEEISPEVITPIPEAVTTPTDTLDSPQIFETTETVTLVDTDIFATKVTEHPDIQNRRHSGEITNI